MQRLATWLLVALAVVVFAAAGYVIEHNDDVAGGGQTPSTPPVSLGPSAGPSASVSAAGASTSTAAAVEPIVAFIGDDWTSGAGVSSKSKRFTSLVSAGLHLKERNFGVDGAGYAKSGSGGDTYDSEVAAAVAAHPAVVVVSGGRNDVSDAPQTAAHHAKELFATLHEKLPDAVLVAIAPMWGDSDQPAELTALAKAVKDGVRKAGGTYVDLPDPIHGHPEFMADDADPNGDGYAAIAQVLQPKLAKLLPTG